MIFIEKDRQDIIIPVPITFLKDKVIEQNNVEDTSQIHQGNFETVSNKGKVQLKGINIRNILKSDD